MAKAPKTIIQVSGGFSSEPEGATAKSCSTAGCTHLFNFVWKKDRHMVYPNIIVKAVEFVFTR